MVRQLRPAMARRLECLIGLNCIRRSSCSLIILWLSGTMKPLPLIKQSLLLFSAVVRLNYLR